MYPRDNGLQVNQKLYKSPSQDISVTRSDVDKGYNSELIVPGSMSRVYSPERKRLESRGRSPMQLQRHRSLDRVKNPSSEGPKVNV